MRIQALRLDAGMPLPSRAHSSDAGLDLMTTTDVDIAPGERILVGTGVALAILEGHAGFVHPRSGLAARHGLTIVNAPGTIDAGYRGEIKVCLLNTDPRETIRLRRGDRIAQLVIQAVAPAELVEVEELDASERETAGHGSSGGIDAWVAGSGITGYGVAGARDGEARDGR